MAEPTNAEIMNAIADLHRHFDGKLSALSTKVDALSTKVDAQSTKVDAQSTKVDAQSTKVDALNAKVESESVENARFRTEVRTELLVIAEHLSGIDKRQDDQNAILAALIPTKIAAVGR